ncbi:MAG TPA: prolipoprotein diacylglyceryl transferase [Acetobacteraceae bacterium]|nr:prolipoprotein diacylglyceryl transferase [Acetobacteraceae bacterium]
MSQPLHWPNFDPVLVQVGPLAIRWYALAYIGSLVIGWRIMRRLVRLAPPVATEQQVDDFLTWATLGVVLGGRLGYVLFYQPSHYLEHPLDAVAVWQGGMSFHGGALGVLVALVLYCRNRAIPLLGFADRLAVVVPLGLGLGRIANFINGELWGREAPAWLPWAMVFPQAGPEPRHPSQLYQAGLEGLALLVILALLCRNERIRARFGTLTGVFLIGYGIARIIGEFFRQPDAFLGFLYAGITMGQLLSLPMVLAGLWLILRPQPAISPSPLGRGPG